MIVDLIVGGFLASINAIFGLIPDVGGETMVAGGSYQTLTGAVFALNTFFPFSMFFICLSVILGLEIALQIWDLILWAYHQFWGSD